MKLPNVRTIKDRAAYAYSRARDPQKLILAFAGITVLIALLLTIVSGWLGNRIEGTGGLSNFGIRSVLSTAQDVLPIAQMILFLGLEFGYLHAILRITRGRYADHTDLKVGFRKLFPALRLYILQGSRFLALGFLALYASIAIFLSTSWSDPLVELLTPIMESVKTPAEIVSRMDAATLEAATDAMLPVIVLFGLLYSLLAIPMFYKLRFSTYILLDDPSGRALLAMRKSTQMLWGNKWALFKLDLSYWWYYLLTVLAAVLSYGDVLLAMLGIPLPLTDTAAFYLFYGLYLAATFAIYYFLRNRVEIAYAAAYDSIVEKPKEGGVVLGSIFDM